MIKIELKWEKHRDFFELWEKHKDQTQLIYVIGETSNVYIGCIGIRDGKGGLGQRYQWQYVQRSMAIFGKDKTDGQVSFSAIFVKPKKVTGEIIGAAESIVQNSFVRLQGKDQALFQPVKFKAGFNLVSVGPVGSIPSFMSYVNQ